MRHLTPALLHAGTNLLFDFHGLPAPLFFRQPLQCLQADQPQEVIPLLIQAEQAALAGHWVGGFLTYEAAAAFALPVHEGSDLPLLWLAIFDRAEVATFASGAVEGPSLSLDCHWRRYQDDLQSILERIACGDSYQVNYTLSGILSPCDPAALFLGLQSAHRHPYAAWIHTDDFAIASLSPELLLQRRGEHLLTAPIKGTCTRCHDLEQDAQLGAALLASPKERAEHVMIVDMARNDLGRVCRNGSVRVDPLLARRLFASVQHLESRVHGLQRPGQSLVSLLGALFPAASITGAPKYRTMEIIRRLERRPRGVYTGGLFLLQPGGDLISNVAIRTIVWQGKQAGRLGLGGGIVADSQAAREWEEIADKGRFLHALPSDLLLIETMLLRADGSLPGLAAHWQRLQDSARALGFICDLEAIEQSLWRQCEAWSPGGEWIVRLTLATSGEIVLQRRPRPVPLRQLRVQFAAQTVDHLDHLLRHKTTRRQLFEHALVLAKQGGADEALFCNGLGRVTEGSIRAVAVRLGKEWFVPTLADGLLASLWRSSIQERLGAVPRSLTVQALSQADVMIMGNSVQGTAQVLVLRDAHGRVLREWLPMGSTDCYCSVYDDD
ncbi:MAG: bifunctional anthranilate synthase component I family protein/class IV aminotransferase [Magnetococcales bacterium]|nr:bifunctional anthranilate synthase component I family protein/class IV aminotransferase [Magnetococcales bacterium]MBF0113914.1 bifunctional anthranilate synthase component I family protein/class IV aminotransferase [Magnetococcales bacterium]